MQQHRLDDISLDDITLDDISLDDISLDDITLTRWEPCVDFTEDRSGAAICTECGWLREEHPAPERPGA
jgi:hypothetical protein